MNFENILVIGICFVAIVIVAYYFYNKYTSQQNDMNALSKRFETIEMMFTTPPPQKELSDIYNRKSTELEFINPTQKVDGARAELFRVGFSPSAASDLRFDPSVQNIDRSKHYSQMEPLGLRPRAEGLVPSKISCEIGLCDLQPLQLEKNATNDETQIAKIIDVDDKINKNEDKINEDKINEDKINEDKINEDKINEDKINEDKINEDKINITFAKS